MSGSHREFGRILHAFEIKQPQEEQISETQMNYIHPLQKRAWIDAAKRIVVFSADRGCVLLHADGLISGLTFGIGKRRLSSSVKAPGHLRWMSGSFYALRS